jgi:integrase
MPYKLIPPKAGRSLFWRVRGTEFGAYLDRSTQTGDRREAARFLKLWRDEAERAALSGPVKIEATFGLAAVAYMNSGRDERFLPPLIEHFKDKPLADIDQAALNAAAVALYPRGSDATRNRQVYSPVSAILKHAGIRKAFQRPKGARSTPRLHWLREEQAWPLIEAASARHARFGAFLTFLLYCGPRLSEAARLTWDDVELERRVAFLRQTKNGNPIALNLPPIVIAALANLEGPRIGRVFRLTKAGRIYALLKDAQKASGIILPKGIAFHILRHSRATWRRHKTGADTTALVATGLWKSRQAAGVYEHLDPSEEARKSDLLPTPKSRAKSGGSHGNPNEINWQEFPQTGGVAGSIPASPTSFPRHYQGLRKRPLSFPLRFGPERRPNVLQRQENVRVMFMPFPAPGRAQGNATPS